MGWTDRVLPPPRKGAARTATDDGFEDPEYEAIVNLYHQRKLLAPYPSPYATKLRRWSYFLLLLLFYEQASIPLQLAFEVPRVNDEFSLPVGQLLFQYVIDVCFWVDIVVQFRTMLVGRPEEGSVLITDTKHIAHMCVRIAGVDGWCQMRAAATATMKL